MSIFVMQISLPSIFKYCIYIRLFYKDIIVGSLIFLVKKRAIRG